MKKLDKKQTSPVLQRKSAPMTKKDVSYKSDMIGMPVSSTRKKVEKNIKDKKVDSPAKMVREKATGEKYGSKSSMMKHEKKESKTEQIKEYGKVKRSPVKQTMGATGLGAGTAEGKYATKKAKEVGSKITESGRKLDRALEGKYVPTRAREESETAFGVRLSGSKAGSSKKSPTKMKKC